MYPGAHLGVIDDGQFSIPAKTSKDWDSAKFRVAIVTSTAAIVRIHV